MTNWIWIELLWVVLLGAILFAIIAQIASAPLGERCGRSAAIAHSVVIAGCSP